MVVFDLCLEGHRAGEDSPEEATDTEPWSQASGVSRVSLTS
jgi:hypothetical protein